MNEQALKSSNPSELLLVRTYNKSLDFKIFSNEQLEMLESGVLGSVYAIKITDSTRVIRIEQTLEKIALELFWDGNIFAFIKGKSKMQDKEIWGTTGDENNYYEFCPLTEELSNYIDLIYKYKIYVDISLFTKYVNYLNQNKEKRNGT